MKKTLSLVLALVMVALMLPFAAFTTSAEDPYYSFTDFTKATPDAGTSGNILIRVVVDLFFFIIQKNEGCLIKQKCYPHFFHRVFHQLLLVFHKVFHIVDENGDRFEELSTENLWKMWKTNKIIKGLNGEPK